MSTWCTTTRRPTSPTLAGCATEDVPYTQLAHDLAAGTLPAFSFITPNLLDDMHTGTIAQGDKWLAAHLPAILDSPEYTGGSTVVFITWDEGQERIFTGLKPEIDLGYADYVMTPEVTYTLQVSGGGQIIPDLFTPECEEDDIGRYWGSWRLIFKHP